MCMHSHRLDNELHARLMWEPRVYMAGLSDEAGAAQPLAIAVKQLGQPVRSEVEKLEAYVHQTLFQAEGADPRRFIQVSVLSWSVASPAIK